jgi:transcriptional regulator with XRE-family HTH domain
MSQLDVAVTAGVSARHLSFVETGRAQPSREMVLLLADVLEVPLRERNALLQAAGFAPGYRETDLGDAELGPIRRSLEFLLERHEPCPAVVCDRGWNLRMQNAAAIRLLRAIVDPATIAPPLNIMRMVFAADGFRPYIVNWPELAGSLIQRLHREALAHGDDEAGDLLDMALASGVPSGWRTVDLGAAPAAIVPMHLRKGDLELRLFSALTTLGTPLDVTVQELRLETFFPADPASEQTLRRLAGG